MITEKDTIRCEAIYNEEHTHRFLWKRVWNKDKPNAAVIMLNPCHADTIVTDTTTSLVVNNIAKLEEFGGVVILNLFSCLTSKLDLRWSSDGELNQPENDDYIKKAAAEASHVIVAWGKSAETSQRIQERVEQVLPLLEPYKEKLYVISDGIRSGIHPLAKGGRRMGISDPELLNAVYKEIGEQLGMDVSMRIYQMFKGQQICFPVRFFNPAKIQQIIIQEYDGTNVRMLATKYNYSEKTVRRIIKESIDE